MVKNMSKPGLSLRHRPAHLSKVFGAHQPSSRFGWCALCLNAVPKACFPTWTRKYFANSLYNIFALNFKSKISIFLK